MPTPVKIVQTPAVALYSPISAAATSLTIAPYPVDLDAVKLTMSDFGTTGYLTVDPKVSGYEEIISFTGITDNGNNTATLTGLVRDLQSKYPYTGSGTGKAHGSSAVVVFSNNPQVVSGYANKANDETIAGQWTFLVFPITPATPLATNLVAGFTKLSVAAANPLIPIAVGDNDPRIANPSSIFAAITSVPSGVMFPYAAAAAPTGFLLCDGTSYLRASFAALFAIIGTTYGSADGTHFNVPDTRGRTMIGAGTGTKVATVASRASNVLTVTGLTSAANNEFQTGQAVVYASSGTDIGGLSPGTYYIIRLSATTFSLASTLANAQNGVVVALSSDGTGTRTFTLTLTARTVGDTGGEENHAMSSTELLAHTHTVGVTGTNSGGSLASSGTASTPAYTPTSSSAGGNAAMNVMQPFFTGAWIIKT